MSKYQNKRIGILGGSFDPPHKGHLDISKIAIKNFRLKKVYWTITKKNPFKKKTFFSLKERIQLARELTKNNKNIIILYYDDILKSSRSIDIVKYILKKKRPENLYFLIGSDNLINFHKWKSWKKLINLVKIIVFSRKGYVKKSKESIVAKYLKKDKLLFVNNKHITISSTSLRNKIKSNL